MKNVKGIIISIVIGFFAFPTITLGGTFASSLIQGKTWEEAVEILAMQMDSLVGRIEVLEQRQNVLESGQEALENQQEVLGSNQAVLENQQVILGSNQNKEEACRKMQELKKAPQETKIAYYSEQNNQPIYADWAPNDTDALLTYLNGYLVNYANTGSYAYMHVPDYTPDLAQQHIPILETRWQEYLVQQGLCE